LPLMRQASPIIIESLDNLRTSPEREIFREVEEDESVIERIIKELGS